MLSYIWVGMIFAAFAFAAVGGKLDALGSAVISSAQNSITLLLFFAAVIPFWNGIMNIASKAGVTKAIARCMRPVLRRLFPESFKNEVCAEAVSMNVAANMLGIGNAATPFGLKAVSEMAKDAPRAHSASNEMITFIVLNTASVQLIPTTVAALRLKAGSSAPFDIVLPVLLCSLCGVCAGLMTAYLLRRIFCGHDRLCHAENGLHDAQSAHLRRPGGLR